MHKSASLEKVNRISTNETNLFSGDSLSPKKFSKSEHYCITIQSKIRKSNSLSDLASTSDYSFCKCSELLREKLTGRTLRASAGDADAATYNQPLDTRCEYTYMFKPKKYRKNKHDSTESYANKFAKDYVHGTQNLPHHQSMSSGVENSCESNDQLDKTQKDKNTFPFKPTPSGNFKVNSKQVVFQSSTVGVLLADPTQAKVQVKFEGKPLIEGRLEKNFYQSEPIQDYQVTQKLSNKSKFEHAIREPEHPISVKNISETKPKSHQGTKTDEDRNLGSLGYSMAEPVDWLQVQLPKKQDLYHEFYRRIHNYINTDTVVRIGDDEYHCHRMVLQVYSSYFDINSLRELELPVSHVTSEAFQAIYEWMIFNGSDCHRVLKRNNVLDLFCAAQFLSIKDLEEQCWSFILNETVFMEDTAFTLFREARIKQITPIMELMIPRVMKFFLPLVASRDFIELELEEVLIFLKSNYICVTSEVEVLMAGVRWLYGDWIVRQQYVNDVMQCVRFGLISPWQLIDIKRNPDNSELLEIVNKPEIQQMIDDGLAYVIIKHWYGNNSKNYHHWNDVLCLTEPAERNWIGEEKNHRTYRDFLKYLEQFRAPKDKIYEQMATMHPLRRKENMSDSPRLLNDDITETRPKMDIPLQYNLKGLTDEKQFPTMSEFFESRIKNREPMHSPVASPMSVGVAIQRHDKTKNRKKLDTIARHIQQKRLHDLSILSPSARKNNTQMHDTPEKDTSIDEIDEKHTSKTESTNETSKNSSEVIRGANKQRVTTCYAASTAATIVSSSVAAAIGRPQSIYKTPAPMLCTIHAQRQSPINYSSTPSPSPPKCRETSTNTSIKVKTQTPTHSSSLSPNKLINPKISLFQNLRESCGAKINVNKMSASILGPSNRNYISEGSLYNWDRETVLIFGGVDPHTAYGSARNTGRDIFRFDPVMNVWEHVGALPEPRHHHSVAFLRGRVYIVGGADPSCDEIRDKSVVVSSVWSFEPVTRSWAKESALGVPRKSFGLVVHRMALYAIGGQDKKGRVLRSVERFDPRTGSWSEVRSMSVARMGLAAAKYREYIWVAGGMTGDRKKPLCKTVECYNSKTNQWTEIYSLRFPRCFSNLFSMNDKFYIIGGAGRVTEKEKTTISVGSIDVWDWKDREWKLLTEMSIPRHGHALAYLGTQLIIIGGVTTIYMRALSNVESFCCERSIWIRGVASLPSPLSGHGAVTLPPASLM